MSDFSNVMKNSILNWIKGVNFSTAPVAVYLSLYSTAVGDDDSGTEITALVTGLNRVAVTFGAIDNNERILNDPAITVTASAANNASIVAIAIHTTATPDTGVLIVHYTLAAPIPVVAGQSVVVPISALIIHIDKAC